MDLSQQELPLTAYFSKPRAATNKKSTSTVSGSQSVSRPSKRRRSDPQRSVANSFSGPAVQSKLRPTTLQLPTPTTSTRKCARDRRPEKSRAEVQLDDTIGQNAVRTSEMDAALESGTSSSRLRQLRRESTEDAVLKLSNVPLATPSARRHKPVNATTPQPSSQPESLDDVDGYFHSGGFNFRLFSQSSRPPYQGPPCSSIGSASSDPFCPRQDVLVLAPRDCASAPSEGLDGQRSDEPILPVLPVPSSQSQYLLHPDATPKRKRHHQRAECVFSSQLHEEEELTLPRLRKPTKDTPSAVVYPGKSTPQNHRDCGKQKSQRIHQLGFTVATSSNSSAGPSCSSVAMDNASNKPLLLSSNSPRFSKGSTPHHPPDCNSKAIAGPICQGSIGSTRPTHPEDSLTESESDSDMLQLKMKNKLSNPSLPSGEVKQVLLHPPASCSSCSPCHGSNRSKFCGIEADSTTEAESDTEIRHCVEQISKKRRSEHHFEASRKITPPPPVISPLVSPAKSRTAAILPMDDFTQSPTRKRFQSRIQGPGCPSTVEHQIQSESLPSVVREFIRMFPGNESYPADFPESLRI